QLAGERETHLFGPAPHGVSRDAERASNQNVTDTPFQVPTAALKRLGFANMTPSLTAHLSLGYPNGSRELHICTLHDCVSVQSLRCTSLPSGWSNSSIYFGSPFTPPSTTMHHSNGVLLLSSSSICLSSSCVSPSTSWELARRRAPCPPNARPLNGAFARP